MEKFKTLLSGELSETQVMRINNRLKELEAIYYLLNDDKRFDYERVIKDLKNKPRLFKRKILELEGINPSIFGEICSVLKEEHSPNLFILFNDYRFLEIKRRIDILKKYLR